MQLKNPARLLTAAVLALTAIVPAAGLSAAQAETVSLPGTIPSLSTWHGDDAGTCTKTAGTIVYGADDVKSTRNLFAEEVSLSAGQQVVNAGADDIQLRIDASRADLKDEGYELKITACACQINVQNDWMDLLLTDMADMKLNYLLLEMKFKSDKCPNANTWSYYTRDDVARLVEKVERLGVEVIPEINSPSHMGIWLENYPQFQLVDRHGNRHPEMLDISNPDAVKYYLDLVDEYKGVFKTL